MMNVVPISVFSNHNLTVILEKVILNSRYSCTVTFSFGRVKEVNCVDIFHKTESWNFLAISNKPSTDSAQGHKWIELLTQAANNKQHIKCLNFQVVPEEINKANKIICFLLCNPHSISQQNGPRRTRWLCLKIPPKWLEILSCVT